jgi:hypothetical protein
LKEQGIVPVRMPRVPMQQIYIINNIKGKDRETTKLHIPALCAHPQKWWRFLFARIRWIKRIIKLDTFAYYAYLPSALEAGVPHPGAHRSPPVANWGSPKYK